MLMSAPSLTDLHPMLFGQAKRPFTDPAWDFEVKYDGYRALAEFGAAGVRIKSRHDVDMTGWFPALVIVLTRCAFVRLAEDQEGRGCALRTL